MTLGKEKIEEIRSRFGESIPIIDHIPSQKEVFERDSWLERIAGTVGLEQWMWKSRRGLIIAIIIVPPGIQGLVEFWTPTIRTGIEYALPYVRIMQESSISLGQRMVAFLTEPHKIDDGTAHSRAILAPTMGQVITASSGISFIDTIVYRLVHPRLEPFDVGGTSAHGGRWSSPGPRLLYTSDSILVAIEELRRYLSPDAITGFALYEIRIAALAEVLPTNAFKLAASESFETSRMIGDDWVRRDQSDVLIVPSRIDPSSHTVIINLSRQDRMRLEVIRKSAVSI